MRLAVITTHPIQYYAPMFKLLAQKIELKVFYTSGKIPAGKYDPGFGKTISWDINLLDGYDYQWINNTASNPGSHHFNGIINPDLIGQLKNWAPDTLLVYGWAYKSHLSVLRYFKNKIPILFRGDSTLLDEKPGIKNLLRYIYLKWVFKHVDYALYAGSNNKKYFKKYGLREDKLVFLPHAVDNERFETPVPDKVQHLKNQLNIHPDDILVLFAGKFEQKKAPVLLLKCFMSLSVSDVHLLFVGNGVLEDTLKQEASAAKNIHFIGFQNQTHMPAIYQACDIFCLPSTGPGETWGLAVNEAMACGKVILVSDKVGCAADLVTAANGAIHRADSFTDLCDKLNLLISKKKKGLHAMGVNSKNGIKNWDFKTQVAHIIHYKNG
ncbi:MAG TPA: glycosyltransferase family 4 protein [Mucilaginibacter sp.]|nr:glycosyltransferase family 4 protein [Mucilaginibacter sp.]